MVNVPSFLAIVLNLVTLRMTNLQKVLISLLSGHSSSNTSPRLITHLNFHSMTDAPPLLHPRIQERMLSKMTMLICKQILGAWMFRKVIRMFLVQLVKSPTSLILLRMLPHSRSLIYQKNVKCGNSKWPRSSSTS